MSANPIRYAIGPIFLYALSYSLQRKRLQRLLRHRATAYPLRVRKQHALEGSIKLADAYALTRLLSERRPRTVLEVGSFLGFSTHIILKATRACGARVTALDPNIRHRIFDQPGEVVEAMNRAYGGTRLEIVTAYMGEPPYEALLYDYSHYRPILERAEAEKILHARPVIDERWGRTFDVIFIDGDHSYASVMKNFGICVHLLERGGTMVFHDAVSWPEVHRALEDIRSQYRDRATLTLPALRRPYPFLAIDGLATFTLNAPLSD